MMSPRPPHSPAARPRLRGERGSVSLELAVVFPIVLLLVFTIVQTGIYYYARTLAMTAAQEGLREASALTGTPAQGTDKATSFLDRTADGWVTGRTVTADRTVSTSTVTVTGQASALLAAFASAVNAASS